MQDSAVLSDAMSSLSEIEPDIKKINGLSKAMRRVLRFFAHVLSDAFAICAVIFFFLGQISDAAQQADQEVLAFMLAGVAWFAWQIAVTKAFAKRDPFWQELRRQLTAMLLLGTVHLLVSYLFVKSPFVWQLAISWGLLVVVLPLGRWCARQMLTLLGAWFSPTLIFGTGANAKEAAKALASEPALGFKVVGFVAAHTATGQRVLNSSHLMGIPVVHWDGGVADHVMANHCHCVLALDATQGEMRDSIIRTLTEQRITDVHVIPAMRGVPLFGMDVSHFFSHEVLMIHVRNSLASPVHALVKRAFDVVVSAVLLLVFLPLLAAIGVKVKRDGGPMLFGHYRVGQDGKRFKCLKFRSMVVDAKQRLEHLLATDENARQEWEMDFKLKNDPRVNAFGQFIRKTSLDELPQLWNVLIGEMSLVGPRPVIQAELNRYGQDAGYYLQVKPGITGLWQVSGRSDVDYETRVYLDSWYVKNWTLWNDIAILFQTIRVVLTRSGAY